MTRVLSIEDLATAVLVKAAADGDWTYLAGLKDRDALEMWTELAGGDVDAIAERSRQRRTRVRTVSSIYKGVTRV